MALESEATREAKGVVEAIAADNGLFTPERRAEAGPDFMRTVDNLKSMTLAATQKLAADLYDKPTHFILECIQNADDNAYNLGVEPKLRFSLCHDRIGIDCNEIGFKDAHVRALCNVGKSTKTSSTDSQDGYIGEKGIGFKSVFKVAKRVHIYSPPYSFDLDNSREMGIITPCWVSNPESISSRLGVDYQTQLTLFPLDGEDFWNLAEDFQQIKPTLLMFMRRLKSIEISVGPCSGRPNQFRHSKVTHTTDWSSDGRYITIHTVDAATNSCPPIQRKFSVSRYICRELPHEPLRELAETSQVVLAFPIDQDFNPVDETQEVHAFLPVRDVGLKFVIQADFLLTSNRQEVHGNSLWNIYLRDCAVKGFLKSMENFRKLEGLQFSWIRFLPIEGVVEGGFWGKLKNDILRAVRTNPTLLTRSGILAKPSEVKSIDDSFLDRRGAPIVGLNSLFISSKYPRGDMDILKRLGVEAFSWDHLIQHLQTWTSSNFAGLSNSWHEDFADIFDRTWGASRQSICHKLSHMPLVPLEGGGWVTTHLPITVVDPIYFRGPPGLQEIPADVQLRLVDGQASQHKSRRALFAALGVQDCSVSVVASLIFKMHDSLPSPSLTQAIEHVRYIFAHESARDHEKSTNLFLYDSNKVAAKGPALYLLTDAGPYSPYQLFQRASAENFKARFLYADYKVPKEQSQRYESWLESKLGVRRIPKLAEGGKVSPDFAFIMKVWPDRVLGLLKMHWKTYCREITPDIELAISSHQVICSNGSSTSSWKLGNTIAPDPKLDEAVARLQLPQSAVFLKLDQYSRSGWQFLERFGVQFNASVDFYLDILLQVSSIDQQKWKNVRSAYKSIGQLARLSEHEKIRNFFRTGRRIYHNECFSSAEECVWDAPESYKAEIATKAIYGNDKDVVHLLYDIIGIKDASPSAVLRDLQDRDLNDTTFKELLSIYRYLTTLLCPKTPSNGELDLDEGKRQVKAVFSQKSYLVIPGADKDLRVKSIDCVWDSPIALPTKHILKEVYKDYGFMQDFLRQILEIDPAKNREVLKEFEKLKDEDLYSLGVAQAVYAYLHVHTKDPESLCNYFQRREIVYVPASQGKAQQWYKPFQCVWKAPAHLTHVVSLDKYYSDDTKTEMFFKKTLSVPDAELKHYIGELRFLSFQSDVDSGRVSQLYTDIQRYGVSQKEYVRACFQDHPLIYMSSSHASRRWKRRDECVWSGFRALKSKASLARPYASFKELFRTFLEIGDATPQMLLKEILGISCKDSIVSEEQLKQITELLIALSTFSKKGLTEPVRRSLMLKRCWPCRHAHEETTTLVSCDDKFFINDRRDIAAIFEGKIPILTFTVEETGRLDDLLKNLKLDSRRLSKTKGKNTSHGVAKDDPLETRTLQMKSEALVRCALHRKELFSSEYAVRLCRQLRSLRVKTVKDIKLHYLINSQGFNLDEIVKGYINMDLDSEKPTIEIPMDTNDAKTAYVDHLPNGLISFLEITDLEAREAIGVILRLETLRQIEEALDRRCIARLPDKQAASEPSDSEDEALVSSTVVEATMAIDPYASKQPPGEPVLRKSSATPPPGPANVHAKLPGTPSRSTLLTPAPTPNGNHEQPHVQSPRQNTKNRQSPVPPTISTPTPSPRSNHSEEDLIHRSPTPSASPWALPPRNEGQEFLGDMSSRTERVVNSARRTDLSQVEVVLPSGSPDLTSHTPCPSTLDCSLMDASVQSPSNAPPENEETLRTVGPNSSLTPDHSSGTPGKEPFRIFGQRSDRQRARDTRVGFEGELFVVEALRMRFPSFTKVVNWTSNLRVYDPGMTEYGHSETTDITYKDLDGKMTEWIYEQSLHMNSDMPPWLQRAKASNFSVKDGLWPTYYLEVKSTTAACDTPFNVSRNQFKIMEEMKVPSGIGTLPQRIYILVRVYDTTSRVESDVFSEAGSSSKKMRLYVDPWSLRETLLHFEAKDYEVTSRSSHRDIKKPEEKSVWEAGRRGGKGEEETFAQK
ncbi:MAG: hypothetical protein M4579_002508 [Chaenotheca gracillima]|nr:MAG: hypothetical protein M4579_002508 [Chaenotheca gracillima]